MTTKNTYEQSLDASQTQLANDVTQIIGEFKSLVVNIYVGNDSFSGRYNAMTNEVSLTDKKQADANKALKNMNKLRDCLYDTCLIFAFDEQRGCIDSARNLFALRSYGR